MVRDGYKSFIRAGLGSLVLCGVHTQLSRLGYAVHGWMIGWVGGLGCVCV